MSKKSKQELLLEDWKACIENIRFFRNQINNMSLWEFGLLPTIGIGVAIKFVSDGNLFYSGITLIVLSFILGFIDNLTHLNARYSLINIKIAQDLEKEIGTSLSSRVKKYYDDKAEEDKKSIFKMLNLKLFHINSLKNIKYLIFIAGLILLAISLGVAALIPNSYIS